MNTTRQPGATQLGATQLGATQLVAIAAVSSALVFGLNACGGVAPPVETPTPAENLANADPLPACESPSLVGEFGHRRSGFAVASGDPHHSLFTAVVSAAENTSIRAKFAYGPLSMDLEDEEVHVYQRGEGCEWLAIGVTRTDNDGIAAIDVSLPRGQEEFAFVVPGDGTVARGFVLAVAEGDPIVVFDIDGTLTVSDGELFEELLLGGRAEARAGSASIASAYASAGVSVVYITGRTYPLAPRSLEWLSSGGFPPGPMIAAPGPESTIPGEPVRSFKREALQAVEQAGAHIAVAYGNASSDVCAYADLGVEAAHTFILGAHGGDACEGRTPSTAVSSFLEHTPPIEAVLNARTSGGEATSEEPAADATENTPAPAADEVDVR